MSFYPVDHSTATFTLGGVKNVGNTCTSSVLLQEFCAFPEIYEPFLHAQLRQDVQESNEHFEDRKRLQAHLAACVQELSAGRSVPYFMATQLSNQLLGLGWLKEDLSFFQKMAPSIFSLPLASPDALYKFVVPMLQHGEETKTCIVLLDKDAGESFQNAIAKGLSQVAPDARCLWRVTKDFREETCFEESFSVGDFTFTLKMVMSFQDKHVVAYRKMENGWILCNDERITAVHEPVMSGVYMVLYDQSYRSSSLRLSHRDRS